MAFAVPAFKTFAMSVDQVSQCRFEQITVISCTGTTADVAYDLGTAAGTFWTSAKLDATHGAKATAALAVCEALKAIALASSVKSNLVAYTWYHTAPSADTDVNIASYTSCIPNIRFKANKAPTAVIWIIITKILNGQNPLPSSYAGTI